MLLETILLQTNSAALDTTNAAVMKLSALSDSIKNVTPEKLGTQLHSFDWNSILQELTTQCTNFILRLIIAIVVFYIGKFVVNKIYKILGAMFKRRGVDPSLSSFLLTTIKITLLLILIISVISILGIETSSFIAVFASAGVAIGMAFSGTLQNFAGGVLILLIKPYKVGDFIEYEEYKGFVESIQVFHTIIRTYNNERIIIPNAGLSTGTVNNFTAEGFHREEWRISVSYGDDVDLARKTILELLRADKRILNQPDASNPKSSYVEPPYVAVESLADSSVVLVIRAWVETKDYWSVNYDVLEMVYKELPKKGVSFPFPQMDVNIKNN